MPMLRKTRLALSAIAATVVTATAAPASFAATVHPTVAGAVVRSAANQAAAIAVLSFSPAVTKGAGTNEYLVGFAGPGCDPQATVCADPAAKAAATWSLDVQEVGAATPTNLAQGTGNSVHTTSASVQFPAPLGTSGTYKVTLSFTDGTTTWAGSTLIDYGTATAAPVAPTVKTDRAEVPATVPLTFTATNARVAAGLQLVVDYGDGSAQEKHDVTAATTTFSHAYPVTNSSYTAWVATTDGVNQSAWTQVAVANVTAADAVLAVSPTSGDASTLSPLTVTLDATGSKTADQGATITNYQFDCGATGVSPQPAGPAGKATCTYTAPGTYQVGVTVTDSKGSVSHTLPQTVTVGAAPAYLPPALGQFTISQDPSVPLTADVDLSHVTLDPRSDPSKAKFTIEWGDGSQNTYSKAQLSLDNNRVTHAYAAAGDYNAQLTVDDGLNQSGSKQVATVRVAIAAPPKGPTPVTRVAGVDRYDTGVQISRGRWVAATENRAPDFLHPDSVVLATGTGFADALAGVPFSVYKNGAMLLTEPDHLTDEVGAEIRRILPADGTHTVYVLGGTKAISPAVVDTLTGLGYHVSRIAGPDRYATALQIAHAMGDPAHTVIARGDDFADALSAGPLASDIFGSGSGANYVPAAVVLSDNRTLDAGTTAYLSARFSGGSGLSVIAVGGGAAQALTTVPGFDGTSATRNSGQLTGDDRFQTAEKVAHIFALADPGAPVGVATGLAYPDALTGGALMASIGGPLLLTDPKSASPAMTAGLSERGGAISGVLVFGGPNAVASGVFDSIVATVHGVAVRF